MKVCDITQFWSPTSGGVKRYVSEKAALLRESGGEHLLIVPGEHDSVHSSENSRVYSVGSPLVSKTTGYRVLLRVWEIGRILAAERPDMIECGDPYQVGKYTANYARQLGVPSVAFYHSHFTESYLRPLQRWTGTDVARWLVEIGRAYTVNFYNGFDATLVPSKSLVETLQSWGVANARLQRLGVNLQNFQPTQRNEAFRQAHHIPGNAFAYVYIGRLAGEKNTQMLWPAFQQLHAGNPGRFHLVVVGEGLQRSEVERLQRATGAVTWISYCSDPGELAGIYHAADAFVHPGLEETFGLVALEAQACGLPVVGFRDARLEAAELVPKHHWASEFTPAALASAMMQTANDPYLRIASLELSQQVRETYDWRRVLEQLFDFYRMLIHNKRS